MPAPPNTIPLGMFYGDSGGPGDTPAMSEAQPSCPFLDPEQGAFCTLDGAMCPFVGFNYRRCKKYTNHLSKGIRDKGMISSDATPKKTGPPRLESLIEAAKKRGSNGESTSADLDDLQTMGQEAGDPEPEGAAAPKKEGTPPKKKRTPRKPRQPKKPKLKNPDKVNPDITAGDLQNVPNRVTLTPTDRILVAQMQAGVDSHAGTKLNPERMTAQDKEALIHSVVSMTGQAEYEDATELREKRIAAAEHIAAVVHQELGIPPSVGKGWGSSIAMVAHVQKGEGWGIQNPDARARALAQAQAANDATMSLAIANPQAHKPSEAPKASVAATMPDVGQGADSHPDPPDPGLGTAENPPGKKKSSQYTRSTPGARFNYLRSRRGAAADDDDDAESIPRTPIRGDDKTYHQQTSQYMNKEQFDAAIDTFNRRFGTEDQKLIFAGYTHDGKNPDQAIKAYKEMADQLADKKDYYAIADLWKGLSSRAKGIDDIRKGAAEAKRAFETSIQLNKEIPIGERAAVAQMVRQFEADPANQTKAAAFLNKLADKTYSIETKMQHIGDKQVQTFIRTVNFPTLARGDYEVIRLTQQMGLAAIQKQHQYGQGYGRWNTWNLFFRSVVAPLVLWWTGNNKLVQPLMHIWPQEFLDQMYFAYVKKPLPKLKAAAPHETRHTQASRDTKFVTSQKMARPTTHDRLMKDWDKDAILPPDRAVMHSRWYPTTKLAWTKGRHAELTKRHQEVKNPSSVRSTVRSFLRR